MAKGGRKKADQKLILALAQGQRTEDAAQIAGVSERTAYRRLEDPVFRRRVAEARDAFMARAVAILAVAGASASLKLVQLMDAGNESVRLGAIRTVFEQWARLKEVSDLATRVAALEERADVDQEANRGVGTSGLHVSGAA